MCFINYYALANFILSSPNNDTTTKTGLATVLSLASVIIVLTQHLYVVDSLDFLLFGGITGISFASIKLRKFLSDKKSSIESRNKVYRNIVISMILSFGLFCVIGIVLAFILYLLISWAFSSSFFSFF